MIDSLTIERKLNEQALKERMVLDSILILATVEVIQAKLEKKLLEIDEALFYNKDGEMPKLRGQVLALLEKLHREEQRMDEYMAKYQQLVNEKKALLSRSCQKKPIYLRGVSPHSRRACEGS